MGGLAGSHAGGLTSRGWAVSLWEQPVRDLLLCCVGGSQGSCMLMMLWNRFLEHMLSALWVIEKYTLCPFPLFSVGWCVQG